MASLAAAHEFLAFVNASPSPFHAVEQCKLRLLAAGFHELKERLPWENVQPRGRYFFTRNQSSIVAFAVGSKYKCGNGFSVIGAHTDSPCLKLKPVSRKESQGYQQVGVQLYGGGLWHTWFDRDLGVAGRVVVEGKDGRLEGRLLRIDRPLLRVPTLAIHLDRSVKDGFSFNNETQLLPILSTVIKAQLEKQASAATSTEDSSGAKKKPNHHSNFMQLIAENLCVEESEIKDFELCLYDHAPANTGGIYNEFIFSPRLDNLMMSFCSLKSLIQSVETKDCLESESKIRMIALFDNEEVGSESAYGAGSNLLESAMRRLSTLNDARSSAFDEAIQKSFLISADMAHAIHPNYSDKHESNHQPQMHGGIVIKTNANQRYATTAVTSAILKSIASSATPPIPLQEFVVRNDSPCGSTIGPILSAKLGLRTIDVGAPMLSMHSIREMSGVDDVLLSVNLFRRFFETFSELEEKTNLD